MNKLTVIMTFRNEGEEVDITLQEIKRTAGEEVDIILVNDASEDRYDYRKIAGKYNHTGYIENVERQGCAASREIGIKACCTPYLFIIDAHMRFDENLWWVKIVEAIETDPRAIYCCRCGVWDYDTKQKREIAPPYAAYMNLMDEDICESLNVYWTTKDVFPDEKIVDVPCVLGACYAASKSYWNYLRGLEGLRLYSYDETFISLKAWMEGGKCKLLKDVVVGHLFRKKFPYKVLQDERLYNRLFIASTLLPEEDRQRIEKATRLEMDCISFAKLKRLLGQHQQEIEELKEYFQKILTGGFERFTAFNASVYSKFMAEEKVA